MYHRKTKKTGYESCYQPLLMELTENVMYVIMQIKPSHPS